MFRWWSLALQPEAAFRVPVRAKGHGPPGARIGMFLWVTYTCTHGSRIATGGDLTMTLLLMLLCELADMGHTECPQTILIQWDGASDNWCIKDGCLLS